MHGWGALEDQFYASIPPHEANYPVSFYAGENGWRWDVIRNSLPDSVYAKIAAIKPPSQGLEDFPCWRGSSDGYFTLR